MFPLLTFATGLVVGIAGVRLLKSTKLDAIPTPSAEDLGKTAREGFDRARSGLRDAAVSGLTAVEKTSAGLREKLSPEPPPAGEAAVAGPSGTVETEAAAEPKATKPTTRRAPRKPAKPAEAAS